MTWEILVGLMALVTSFLSVMGVVVKVNRSIVALEEAVKQLTATVEKQQRKNSVFSGQLSMLEKRLSRLEVFCGAPDGAAAKLSAKTEKSACASALADPCSGGDLL